MNDVLSLPTIQTLGLTLLHFLWQGSIVGIVLFVTLCILCKPQIRCAISYIAFLILAALPILFYHPVVWWVSNQIRKEREYCCDDIAVSLTGASQHYAQTLLTLAEMRVQLAPDREYGWGIAAFDKYGKMINTAYGDVFKTE
jgi:Zn-dependent protease with chaperone function